MKTIVLLSFLLPSALFVTGYSKGKRMYNEAGAEASRTYQWETDTIYKDNRAYGLLLHKGRNIYSTEYSIRTLSNVEIAFSKFDANAVDAAGASYYRFTFLGSGASGHFPVNLKMDLRIKEAVVENELIGDTAVNPAGERRFLLLYPGLPVLAKRDNCNNCEPANR